MSEQEKPKSFMQELDEWSMAKVVRPLHDEINCQRKDCNAVVKQVMKAIREKVLESHEILESYKNGLKAGHRAARRR